MSEHASALLPNLVAGLLLAGKRDAKEIGGLAVTFDVTKEADIRCLIKAGANLKVLEQPVDTRPAPVVPSSACWRYSPPSRQTSAASGRPRASSRPNGPAGRDASIGPRFGHSKERAQAQAPSPTSSASRAGRSIGS
jgi:hypothetical protein